MANLTEEMKKLLGIRSYAETSYASVVVEYCPEFIAMLKPYPPKEILEFELKQFKCKTCKTPILMIAAECTVYDNCEECKVKKSAKAAEESKKAKEKNESKP